MMWRRILLTVCSFLIFRGDASDTPTQIFDRLMKNYSRNEAPGFHGKSTEVKLGIYVNNIQLVSDKTSEFTVTFYLRQAWKDPRLRFSSPDGNTKGITFPQNSWDQIWRPDTFIRSSLSVKVADDFSSNRILRVSPDGEVWYVAKLTAVIPLHLDLRRYPFNKQKCALTFESFGHTMDVLYFTTLEHPIDISKDITLSQFRITDSDTEDCSMNYTSGAYPCLMMAIVLDRNTRVFVFQYYLPSIIFVVLSWLTFWTDPETSSVSRLLTGIFPLLALVLLNALAGHSAFVVHDATLIVSWAIVCYVFVFATLVEYVVVSLLLNKPSGARGLEYFKPPFAGTEKAIEASEKPGDGSSGDGKRRARLVDWFSRICFPIAFILFNLIYFIANA